MDVFNNVANIDLMTGLNISPIPLEFSQEMTTTKWLAGIQAKINEVINYQNSETDVLNKYMDNQVTAINKMLDDFLAELKNGTLIPDGSLSIAKMNSSLLADINNLVFQSLRTTATFVTFGLTDDGHFCAYVPDSWTNVTFETDHDGKLILNY